MRALHRPRIYVPEIARWDVPARRIPKRAEGELAMMKRIFVALLISALPVAALHAPAMAADSAKEQALSPEQKKELKKIKNALGNGELSSKQYQVRKQAILDGKTK